MALFCTVFEIFDLEKYCDLEIWVRGHSLFILCALQAYESTPVIITVQKLFVAGSVN